ncbi:MAG TPA: Bpu10I family restriction endonuclease [Flavobacteriales bacterium]|mgnify:CR=1 FL=1|nr:Bpu10I family restriction endonuclease [Flavobacteriales bacterium]HMR28914.1 Bpu10I family restriction endonuclease [Flavobacteriales bacterium]
MPLTPHLDKLNAALRNQKCDNADRELLQEVITHYTSWRAGVTAIQGEGKEVVAEMTRLLNLYKDELEVEIIAKKGSPFLKRQKGQMKLDSSVLEEFLIDLVRPQILKGLPSFPLTVGPNTAFMSLSFTPSSVNSLNERPEVTVKVKDQDFVIGKNIHYRLSPDPLFASDKTTAGSLSLAVLAAECKVNLDKTMFQEAAGTAARLKQGCPHSQYYILNEYLDMTPEDCRLTSIDNVLLLRHAKRLPFEKRTKYAEVRAQHQAHPIDPAVVWLFVEKMQAFISAVWYDPAAALRRGAFI